MTHIEDTELREKIRQLLIGNMNLISYERSLDAIAYFIIESQISLLKKLHESEPEFVFAAIEDTLAELEIIKGNL